MKIYWRVVTLVAVTMLVTLGPAKAGHYYLAPDGDDSNAGTREAPWESLEKASETARAGDTIVLLPGRYPGRLRPVDSGTADAPIVFRAEPRMGATLTGPGGDRAIVLEDLKHISLEGLHVEPEISGVGWLTMRNCSQVTVEDCRMENSTAGLAAQIEDSEDIRLLNSVFQKQLGGVNMFRIVRCTRILFEGNVISRAGHSPLQLRPDNATSYVVMRGNVFHAAWGRNFEHFGTHNVLFEHNIVTHAFNSGRSGSANAKFATTHGIFRFNRVFRNPHGPIHLYPFRDVWLDRIRLYNNVFDDNGHYGIAVRSSQEQTRDLVFANNIFSRNDPHGMERQIQLRGGSPGQVRMVRNAFAGTQRGLPLVHDYGDSFTVEALQEAAVQAEHGARYEGNMDADPGFVDAETYDHALREDSPLRDAGVPLTRAVGAGESARLAVEDAAPFYDGFGIEGEKGDLIAVGAPDRRARVVEVDHDANTLLLDREVRWSDGDPVSLPWSGEAPDMGVYENGGDGRVGVQVVVEPFEVRPGEEVTMRAVIHGDARPERIRWWLGDGSVAEGGEITHRYDEEHDYAIRVQVVDTEGRTHYGPGYVWVAEPTDPSAPLIHSTWDPDDDTAWWLWKSYGYPGPAAFVDIVEGGVRHAGSSAYMPEGYEPPGPGTNFRHVFAPEDRGGLPARVHPDGWDIDLYPEVFVRYRVSEGTPVALSLKPFGRAPLLVALTPAGESDLSSVADHVLHDDAEWHELDFDVRKVRGVYPDLQVLEGLYFLSSPQDAVREGQWYDLDEVLIRPAANE